MREFKPGVRTLVERNPDYWRDGRPWLDEIELIGIPDELARVNALLKPDMRVLDLGAGRGAQLLDTRSKYRRWRRE